MNSKGFTNQKPFQVDAEDIARPWSGGKNGKYFRCYLCGHRFVVGDTARWQDSKHGSFFVCSACDGPKDETIQKWIDMKTEYAVRFWWFKY